MTTLGRHNHVPNDVESTVPFMVSIFLNNNRHGGRRSHATKTDHRRDDKDEEGIGDNASNNNCDYENCPRPHRNDGNPRPHNHKRRTMAVIASGAVGGKNLRGGAGGGKHLHHSRKIVHSASSSSSSRTTATSIATTTLSPNLLKSKKSSQESGSSASCDSFLSGAPTATWRGTRNGEEMNLRTQNLQTHRGGRRHRYLCSFDRNENDDDKVNEEGKGEEEVATDNGTASFPSLGLSQSSNSSTPSLSSSSSSSFLRIHYRRPTPRLIHGGISIRGGAVGRKNNRTAGLTRIVLSTMREKKTVVLQRDLRPRGKRTSSSTTNTTLANSAAHDHQEKERKTKTACSAKRQHTDNICVYKYADDDLSVEFDAAEIIYGSVSLSTSLAEDDDGVDDENDNGGGGESNAAAAVRERKFSLFYEEDEADDEHYRDGMGGGGCIMDLIGVGGKNVDVGSGGGGGGVETFARRRMRQREEQLRILGKNGWHRALAEMVILDTPAPPTAFPSTPGFMPLANSSTDNASLSIPPLDRLSVAHILQNSQPTVDEYSAVHEEYKHLLKEIECLEKDRVQLELLFYGAVEDAEEERKLVALTGGCDGSIRRSRSPSRAHERQNPTKDKDDIDNPTKLMAYQTFRTSLNRITRSCQRVDEDILKSPVPITWLIEDILPLLATESVEHGIQQFNNDNGNSASIKTKAKKRQIFHSFPSSNSDDEPNLEDRLRNFRGDGIALLVADKQSRISLVERCCSQLLPKKKKTIKKRSYGIGSTSFSSAGSSSYYSSPYAPPATYSSSDLSIDPTSIDMLALMKLKSEGDQENEEGTFDDHNDEDTEGDINDDDDVDDDPSAAVLIDEGGTYLTHCAITGGLGGSATPAVTLKDKNRLLGDRTAASSYFLKFDNGKVFHGGGVRHSLPSNLFLRLVREGRDPSTIKYLSTGPFFSSEMGGGASAGYNSNNSCYYAEFDDGECWWCTNNDDILDKVFMEMDVHRVAFGTGSSEVVDGAAAASTDTTISKSLSFVVIGKDGAVKWKNVPRGLHNALMLHKSNGSVIATSDEHDHTAAAAAPCEVSLGMDGSYFVRFLDATVDYVLPNFAADIFDKLEACGKQIRNVALHVETYDCLIRYSS